MDSLNKSITLYIENILYLLIQDQVVKAEIKNKDHKGCIYLQFDKEFAKEDLINGVTIYHHSGWKGVRYIRKYEII
jgi:hypothetical protein